MGMKLITVLLPIKYLNVLDDIARAGLCSSRSEAIRSAVRMAYLDPQSNDINPVLAKTLAMLQKKHS